MYSFIFSIALLILGYILYGTFVEKVFVSNSSSATPVHKLGDGVDYVPMSRWRLFLIQFLNIAGLGPIFGAIMGVMYGPSAFLWIVFGSILGGAVHDYLIGMMSVRFGGKSLPEVLGEEFGHYTKWIIRFLSVITIIMLILLVTSFLSGVAVLLQNIIPLPTIFGLFGTDKPFVWLILIFIYFGIATIFPIDTIIGRFYPFFGVILLFMGIGVSASMLINHSAEMPEIITGLHNYQADGLPVFPMMFMSISCGALSGFHGTQATMTARCMTNERQGRLIFYGAMICEGFLALIWAYATVTFFADPEKGIDGYTGLSMYVAQNPEENLAALIVNNICHSWLGVVGGFIAVIGVIVAPITSGDTALRSARLMLSDALGFDQKRTKNRLLLTSCMLAIVTALLFVNFNPLWRYFSWINQIIAVITLWGGTVFLFRQEHRAVNPTKYRYGYLISMIPAVFMTFQCICYVFLAPEGMRFIDLGIPALAYLIAASVTLLLIGYFVLFARRYSSLNSGNSRN